MTAMNAAAASSAQIGADTLAFYKQVYAEGADDRGIATDVAQQTAKAGLESLTTNTALAKEYADYNRSVFRPLEQGIVKSAEEYDTPEKRNAAAAAALADVNMGAAGAQEANARRLAANGVNPGSAKSIAAMDNTVGLATAGAGAAYKARKGVELTGNAMKMDAASLGRGLASNQATSAQIALTAGNSATSNAMTVPTMNNQGAITTGQGYNAALNGSQIAGNLYGQAAQIEGQESGVWGALGSAAGGLASNPSLFAASDVSMKKDIEPMADDEALAATNATPVSKWKYDPAKMAAQGIPMGPEDQGEQIGPMAQDVNATMGGAASDGKKLNMVTMNGINMKAVQAVDKKVEALAKEVSMIAAMIRGGQLQAAA